MHWVQSSALKRKVGSYVSQFTLNPPNNMGDPSLGLWLCFLIFYYKAEILRHGTPLLSNSLGTLDRWAILHFCTRW